jgi:acetyl esterase/lipase
MTLNRQILAAYYDSQCNGRVFLVGGSSGASHSLWAALDPNPTVPGWPVTGVPKAIVSLSGVFDLSSRVGDNQQALDQFIFDVRNYTNTTDPDTPEKLAYQYSVSPLSLVAAATNIPPIRLYTTEKDPVPHQQSDNMKLALQAKGANVLEWTIPGINLHSFQYWHTLNPNTGKYVSVEAIEFLKSLP